MGHVAGSSRREGRREGCVQSNINGDIFQGLFSAMEIVRKTTRKRLKLFKGKKHSIAL